MQPTLDQGASHGQPAARNQELWASRSGSTTSAGNCSTPASSRSLIAEDGISGVTSNPTIFEKAIGHSDLYDRALSAAAHDGLDARAIFFKLAYADIREGADLLRPAFDAADGQDGHISFELPPELALDPAGSVSEAKRFFAEIDRPNVFIKVPATPAGVEAFRRADRGRRLGQRHAAVRGPALRGDRERLDRRPRASASRPASRSTGSPPSRASSSRASTARSTRGSSSSGTASCRASRRSRTPSSPTARSSGSSRARAGRRWRPRARTSSARSGRRRRRRTRPTPTRSTSTR